MSCCTSKSASFPRNASGLETETVTEDVPVEAAIRKERIETEGPDGDQKARPRTSRRSKDPR
jgi:hypothetical protein